MYQCTNAVVVTNNGNVRLNAIGLSGTVDNTTCTSDTGASLTQLEPGRRFRCAAKHTTILDDFEAGRKDLQVTAQATALGFSGGAASISTTSANKTLLLPSRRTATLNLELEQSATPVVLVGERRGVIVVVQGIKPWLAVAPNTSNVDQWQRFGHLMMA